MGANTKTHEIADSWWPSILRHIPDEKPLNLPMVTVAEMRNPNESATYEYRTTVTALIPTRRLKEVSQSLRHLAEFATEVSISDFRGIDAPAYVPRFWLNGGELGRFETLVVSWQGANKFVLMPDQGFLATYRLIPRVFDLTGEIHWDEPETPTYDVVVSQPLSVHSYGTTSSGFVKIRREFLQDYATVRKCALVQVIFENRSTAEDSELRELLGTEDHVSLERHDHKIWLRRFKEMPGRVLAEVWAARIIICPGKAPISVEDSGALVWPGIEKPVTKDTARRLSLTRVYVRDAVLGKFEAAGGYTIHPEHGSVSNNGQWSVSYSERLGRDIIALELRKLYEGNRASIIRHWHSFAIEPPEVVDLPLLRSLPNVASRSKKIVMLLLDLGELIASYASKVLGSPLSSRDVVGLLRSEVNYRGWWTLPEAERVSRHISIDISEDNFLVRCGYLHQLAVECWSEKILRRLLKALGAAEDEITELRSLKLLSILVDMAYVSSTTGLDCRTQGAALFARRAESPSPALLARMFALNDDLRQLAGHRGDRRFRARLTKALGVFGIDPASASSGYGTILDEVYDGVLETLQAGYQTLLTANGIT